MSKLDELIAKLCPNGVEYKKLKEVATISRGGSFQKKDYEKRGFPCIHYGQIYTLYRLFVEKTANYISNTVAAKQKKAVTNDIIMAVTSENIEDVCKCVAWLGEGEIAVSGHTAIIHHRLDPKYLVYYLHSSMFYSQKVKLAHGTKVLEVKPDSLGEIKLPVPPLEIQREIVHVLDNFTLLTTKLTTEIADELRSRKKQYEFYMRQLLSFKTDIIQYKLRELVEFKNGKGHEKDIVADGRFIVVNSKFVSTQGEVKKFSNRQICPVYVDDILMVMSDLPNGKALAKCFLVNENEKYTLNQRIGCFHVTSDLVTTKFLYYVMNRNYQLLRYDNGADQTNLRKDDILDIFIPIPSKEAQNRITAILDTFDKLCNDISDNLPAEIATRQKQYEYYRDKLLSFKELNA